MTAIAATLDSTTFLRRVLMIDAATCVGTGALLALDTGALAGLLGLPAALLFYAGLSLFPCAALMLLVALREPLARGLAWVVVIGNIGWVGGSVALLAILSPSALGYAFVIGQAAAVGILAELEIVGLRKAAI